MVQGKEARTTTAAERTALRSEIAPFEAANLFRPRQAIQTRKKGSSEPSEGFVISVKPQRRPYRHQSRLRLESATQSVAHRTMAARSAESDVSQIHSKGMTIPAGKIAQSEAASAPTRVPATRRPAK